MRGGAKRVHSGNALVAKIKSGTYTKPEILFSIPDIEWTKGRWRIVIRTGPTSLPHLFGDSNGQIFPEALYPSSRIGSQAWECRFSFLVQGSPGLQYVVGSADELPFRRTPYKSPPH